MVTYLALFLALAAPIPHYYAVPGVAISSQPVADYWADAYLIPRFLVRRNVAVESGWNHRAVSLKGARGLTQILQKWERELVWFARSTDPGRRFHAFNPGDSLRVGFSYLSRLHRKYGRWDYAIGASNCGPGRFDQWIENKRALPRETILHIRKVMG